MAPTRSPVTALLLAKYAVVALVILSALWIMPLGCTDPAAAVDAAGDAGLSHIVPTGYRHFGCGWSHSFFKGYGYQTGFVATTGDGKSVVGVVCAGQRVAPYVHVFAPGTLGWRLRDW